MKRSRMSQYWLSLHLISRSHLLCAVKRHVGLLTLWALETHQILVIVGETDHDNLLQILDTFEESIKDDIPSLDTPWKRLVPVDS